LKRVRDGMSMIIPSENDRTDPDGRTLVPSGHHDTFRHRQVWAVYKFYGACRSAESRHSEFVGMASAKETADELNRTRTAGDTYYFRVYRLANQLLLSA
jgi:hypothetical protein